MLHRMYVCIYHSGIAITVIGIDQETPLLFAIVKQSVRGPAPLVRTSLPNQFVLYFTFNMRVLDIYRTMRIQFPEFFFVHVPFLFCPLMVFSQSFYLIEILHKNFIYFFILCEWQKRWKMHQNWALMTFKLFGYFALMASATSVRKSVSPKKKIQFVL